MSVVESEIGAFAHFRNVGDARERAECFGAFSARGDNDLEIWRAAEQVVKVEWLDDAKMEVAAVVVFANDLERGVSQCDAFVFEKRDERGFVEFFLFGKFEVVRVVEPDESLHAPHVVLEVGIVEVDGPAHPLRRKTAEKDYPSVGRNEKSQRMILHVLGSCIG